MPAGGFTLIELLVVISIIALLIAIMLPALAKARAVARSSQCLALHRQIGIAAAAYSAENQGILPPGKIAGIADPTTQRTWKEQIDPYLNNLLLVADPRKSPMQCPEWEMPPSKTWTSFGFNRWLEHDYSGGRFWYLETVRNPSHYIHFGDHNDYDNNIWITNSNNREHPRISGSSNYALGIRHNLNPALVFVDGHAAVADLLTIVNSPNPGNWFRSTIP